MKLALGWTDASGDKQWIRWSLYRVEELCGNTVVVLVVSCRREGTASQALLVRLLKVASPFSNPRCFDFDFARWASGRRQWFGNDPACVDHLTKLDWSKVKDDRFMLEASYVCSTVRKARGSPSSNETLQKIERKRYSLKYRLCENPFLLFTVADQSS